MRNWERPMAVVDTFAANEFVSTCGEKNQVYLFKCDAGNIIGMGGYVYLETNGQPGLQTNSGKGYEADQYLSTYHKCSETHEAKTTDEFLNGYLVPYVGFTREVIIWRGEKNDNTHCTTKLNKDEWTTVKS